MTISDSYFFAQRAPQPEFHIILASHITSLENPYRMYAKNISSELSADVAKPRTYPYSIRVISAIVVIGTIVSGLIGYLFPGLFAGIFLPIFVTLWWLLYRTILTFDRKQHA